MPELTPLIDHQIQAFVSRRQFDRARALCLRYPDDARAQQYLLDIDSLETRADRAPLVLLRFIAYGSLVALAILIVMTVITLSRLGGV